MSSGRRRDIDIAALKAAALERFRANPEFTARYFMRRFGVSYPTARCWLKEFKLQHPELTVEVEKIETGSIKRRGILRGWLSKKK